MRVFPVNRSSNKAPPEHLPKMNSKNFYVIPAINRRFPNVNVAFAPPVTQISYVVV